MHVRGIMACGTVRESKGPAYDTSCKECSPAARGVETSPERRPCLRYLDGHESCANAVELPRPNTAGHGAAAQGWSANSGARAKDAPGLPAAHAWGRPAGSSHQLSHGEPQIEEVGQESSSMVLAHNSYVVAKDQAHACHRQRWPTFLDFLESLGSDLIGDTRAERA